MAEAIPTSAGHLSITLRIGVTLVEPGENPDEIISRADHAMDRAKQTGRHRVLPFSEKIASPRADRSDTWQSVLRGGLPAGRRCRQRRTRRRGWENTPLAHAAAEPRQYD